MLATQLWWYTARSSGIVAWALMALSVVWGLALSTKVFGKKPRPNWLLDLHRFLGGLAVVFVAIHIAAIVADSYVQFGAVDILVPFASAWRPVAVAWGILSMYALLAVEITSLMRRKLSKQAWRAVHYLSFPLFALATIHLLTAGRDSDSVPLRVVVLTGALIVIALSAVRAYRADRHDLMVSPPV